MTTTNTFSALRKALHLLPAESEKRLVTVLAAMVATALLELVGVGSILPFLEVVTDPSSVQQSGIMNTLYTGLGFQNVDQFLIVAALGVLVLIVSTQLLAAVSKWLRIRFTYDLNHDVSIELLKEYMSRPYQFFGDTNTSEMTTNILNEADYLISGIFRPGLKLASKLMVAVALIGLLLWVDPVVTVFVLGGIGGAYVLIYTKIRKRLRELGKIRTDQNRNRFQTANEALGGIKEARVLGREPQLVDRYRGPSRDYADTRAKLKIYNAMPGHVMRALTFGGLMAILIYFMSTGRPVLEIVPLIGVFAFAGYRLMPAIEGILKSVAQIDFHHEILDQLHEDLENSRRREEVIESTETPDPIPFEEQIELRDVTFQYSRADEPVFEGLDATIPRGEAVAFVGSTGAGKTTLVDMLLCLLPPDEGELLVDGQEITSENADAWQRRLGYIPQEIYLADDTVERNIAYGVPDEQLDRDAVVRAAKIAQIHDFIVDELPQGYETEVGERGIRLSGGQRQRLGIARGLYHDPDVVLLDEATSDIDGETEARITTAIEELAGAKTLVIVAHRLSTIEDCDRIYLLDGGELVASGDYDELLSTSDKFRRMAEGLTAT